MNWELSTAKNGEVTLSLNGVQLYSRYRPREDAWKWVDAEFDAAKSSYLLIGLGLGYHAERLLALACEKPVNVYYFDDYERQLAPLEQAISTIDHLNFDDCQILIPNVWIKALGEHPILPFLEDIKMNQMTYKRSADLMEHNFDANVAFWSKDTQYPCYTKKTACLVASGPSLNETIEWLKEAEGKTSIFVVGSTLKMVLAHSIQPDAAIISDAKANIVRQIDGTGYNGDLYFLSTANEQAVKKHNGPAYIMFQQGYPAAERLAAQYNMPVLETGGSVSTTAISLLEQLGFEQIILFGQDMGFSGNATHAQLSTSGRIVQDDTNIREVPANDGSVIYTTPNLHVYARWIEKKAARMSAKLYTTASKGVALQNIELINKEQFLNCINAN